ncbi:competence protein CoiA [Lottiidibacillus patelloidae]|uniref:competence protein CoiA n=1 Tax=Lottiidibacillus patelloidae TaxID=2670334 RepID=UPI001E5A8BE4|nr:competence protein CoiA family protein [Lottiidibacillus patelloidae]
MKAQLKGKKKSFYCPICEERLLLKAGNKRRWHFAHQKNSSCLVEQEAETEYHLNGKILLYQWLKKQYRQVYLEYYIRSIKQRPDILVQTEDGPVAIEFQCSNIPESHLIKRTEMYNQRNIKPLWILGSKRLKRKKNYFQLTAMDWLTVQFNTKPFVVYFNPTNKQFTLLHSLSPFSEGKVFAGNMNMKLHHTSLQQLIHPLIKMERVSDAWFNEKRKWRLSCHYENKKAAHFIRNELQKKRLHLCYIPSVCGVPHNFTYLIKTPTVYWQTWIFLKFLYKKEKYTTFDSREIINSFAHCAKVQKFSVRRFPCISGKYKYFAQAIHAYLQLLCNLNYLRKKSKHTYIIMNEITPTTSNYEAIGKDKSIVKKINQFNNKANN